MFEIEIERIEAGQKPLEGTFHPASISYLENTQMLSVERQHMPHMKLFGDAGQSIALGCVASLVSLGALEPEEIRKIGEHVCGHLSPQPDMRLVRILLELSRNDAPTERSEKRSETFELSTGELTRLFRVSVQSHWRRGEVDRPYAMVGRVRNPHDAKPMEFSEHENLRARYLHSGRVPRARLGRYASQANFFRFAVLTEPLPNHSLPVHRLFAPRKLRRSINLATPSISGKTCGNRLDGPPVRRENGRDKMVSPPRRRAVVAPSRRPPVELRAIRIIFTEDPAPDASYLNEAGRTALKQREFTFVRAIAEADVVIDGIQQTLTSGGVGSIESDAEDYVREVVDYEWHVLRGVLKAVGVPTDQLPVEAEQTWVEWRL